MDNLAYDLCGLCQRNKDGSYATQSERLAMVSKQLKSGGFRNMRSASLKEKYITYLVKLWQTQEQ